MKKHAKFAAICAVAAVVLLVLAGFLFRRAWVTLPPDLPVPTQSSPGPLPISTPAPTPNRPTPTPRETPPALEPDGLPHDKLFITVERQHYADGDLRLLIPKLEVDVPILNGVDGKTLLRGVGLYDYAQLPGEGDRNVSLAGHRNGLKNGKITDGMPFYYIDTLAAGDCLYLRDSTQIYRYLWESTQVVEPDDWGPIYSQGFSCLTLTSCTPIGVSDHRIIVRGRLAEILPLTEKYDYPAQTEEASAP